MGKACSIRRQEERAKLQYKRRREGDYLENLDVNVRIILKYLMIWNWRE
jgi:hypothetical protein